MAKKKAKKAKSVAAKKTKKSGKTTTKRKITATVMKKAKKAVKKAVKKATKKVAKKVVKKAKAVKSNVESAVKGYKGPKIGDVVPHIAAPATGEDFDLGHLKGKNLVLYFYPKDDTPGCTLEGHDFTRLKKDFEDLDTVVYGISRDSMDSHEKFKEKQCYSVDLISDEDETICKLFDVIQMKNMYGNMVLGVERSTFVIDKEGVLRGEWRKVSVPGHAEEVLQFVKNL